MPDCLKRSKRGYTRISSPQPLCGEKNYSFAIIQTMSGLVNLPKTRMLQEGWASNPPKPFSSTKQSMIWLSVCRYVPLASETPRLTNKCFGCLVIKALTNKVLNSTHLGPLVAKHHSCKQVKFPGSKRSKPMQLVHMFFPWSQWSFNNAQVQMTRDESCLAHPMARCSSAWAVCTFLHYC